MDAKRIAIEFLKRYEGLSLRRYNDVGGVATIGYGHTGPELPQEITQVEADEMLEEDVDKFFMKVLPLIKVTLNDNQLAAILSFTYNVGVGAFASSTMLNKLSRGVDCTKEFARWNHVKGKVVTGLTNRRAAELELFLTPVAA